MAARNPYLYRYRASITGVPAGWAPSPYNVETQTPDSVARAWTSVALEILKVSVHTML